MYYLKNLNHIASVYFNVGNLSCRNLSMYGAVDIKLDYSLDGTTTLQLQCCLVSTADFLTRCRLDGTLIGTHLL